MGTREKLLLLFETNKGIFFSGEEIAGRLSVSRAAVWKAVKTLRNEGYVIDAVPNKGYCLSEDTDILSVQGVEKYLSPLCKDLEFDLLPVVDSTNTRVYEQAVAGAKEGYTVIAANQTKGRGRRGRSFYSPADTGVYMSILLRPKQYSPNQALELTTMAAVAACEAIETVSGKEPQIKWVNDIYLSGRKVSGILTEASFELENGFLEYAILGIGMNVFEPKEGFPEEIKEIAGAVFDAPRQDGKNHLVAEFLNHFMEYYKGASKEEYVQAYRRRSFLIGKEIRVLCGKESRNAIALDVDEACHLIVRYEDGTREALSSGEVQVRELCKKKCLSGGQHE